jgi:hypothetical protein
MGGHLRITKMATQITEIWDFEWELVGARVRVRSVLFDCRGS